MNPFRRRQFTAMQGAGGAAAFSPTSITGMAAWWAARKESFANNDPVGTATDWTGNGLSLTQATASKKPLFLANQKNGLPAFSADGVDDFFSGGDILDIGTGSIHFFFVAKYDSVAADYAMMAKSVAAGQPNRYSGVNVISSQWNSFVAPTSMGPFNLNTGTANTNWHLFEFVVDRPLTKVAMWLDGVEIASSSAVPAGDDINSTFRFLLFAYNNATDTGEVAFMPGKIAEVWCWQRVLTAGERDTLRIGAANLYNIPVYTSQFLPNQIAGLQLWLDASQITGLNDGDAVATWSDASGNANNATQGTAAARPLYKVNIKNGKPALLFDGVDDGFTLTTGLNLSAYTVFVVWAQTDGVNGSISFHKIGDNYNYHALVPNAVHHQPGGPTVMATYATSTAAGDWVLTEAYRSGTTLYIGKNGTFGAGQASSINWATDAIGANYTGGGVYNMAGYIAEMLVYDSGLVVGDRQLVEAYLIAKYGL